MEGLTEDERAALDVLTCCSGRTSVPSTCSSPRRRRPLLGLADSPVALLAWNSQLMLDQDDDFLIGNVATYWFTGTAGSSIRLYRENHLAQHRPGGPPDCSDGTSSWGNDFRSIRRFAERDHLRHPDVAAA